MKGAIQLPITENLYAKVFGATIVLLKYSVIMSEGFLFLPDNWPLVEGDYDLPEHDKGHRSLPADNSHIGSPLFFSVLHAAQPGIQTR